MEPGCDVVTVGCRNGRMRRKMRRMERSFSEMVMIFVVTFCLSVEQTQAVRIKTTNPNAFNDLFANVDLTSSFPHSSEGTELKRGTSAPHDPRLTGQVRQASQNPLSARREQMLPGQKPEEDDALPADRLDDPRQASSRQQSLSGDTGNTQPMLFSRQERDEYTAAVSPREKRETGIAGLANSRALSRQRRMDDPEPALVRGKRGNDLSEPALSRQKRVSVLLEDANPALSGQKRSNRDPEQSDRTLSRQKRVSEDSENPEPSLFREKRASEDKRAALSRSDKGSLQLKYPEPFLSREKRFRDDLDYSQTVLSRQKRLSEDLEDSGDDSNLALSRQKRSDDDSDTALSRQKRFDDDSDTALSRQKRFDDDSDVALSRQKRFDDDSDLALSRQKRFDDDSHLVLSRQKRFDDDSDVALSRQKRFDDDSDVDLSRQKRFDGDSDVALSRQKRFDDDSDVALSRKKRFADDFNLALSKQKRFDDDSDLALLRQKRVSEDLIEMKSLPGGDKPLSEDTEPDEQTASTRSHADSVATESIQKRRLLASRGELPSSNDEVDAALTKQEAALEERRQHEPEHKLYNEDLLLRRLRAVRLESKRRKRNREPEIDEENEDSWEQELRIRSELAEKATEYGIQKRKERLKNPDPRDMSVLQRIQQDAEEILRRRAQEEQYVKGYRQDGGGASIQTALTHTGKEDGRAFSEDGHTAWEMTMGEDRKTNVGDEDEREGVKKKKPEKAILKLLNLKSARQEARSSEDVKETEAKADEAPGTEGHTSALSDQDTEGPDTAPSDQDTEGPDTAPSDQDTVLRFQRLLSEIRGKVSKKKRNKLKRNKKALKRGKGRNKRAGLLEKLDLPAPALSQD